MRQTQFLLLRLVLLLFLISGLKAALAQTWPPNEAEWYYKVSSMGGVYPPYVSYQNIAVEGDTVINSQNCKIITRQNEQALCDNMGRTTEYIYEENSKVYWYNTETETFTLLYDFTAEQGDTWSISVDNCSFDVFVDSINYISINGVQRKKLHITSDEPYYFSGSIIENIGHTTSMFPDDIYWECNGAACDSDYLDGLRCYLEDNSMIYKPGDVACDTSYLITSNSRLDKDKITLGPNPFENILKVQVNNTKTKSRQYRYSIYNMLGRNLLNGKVTLNSTIDLSNLNTGIYIFLLESSNRIIYKQKIMKK
ncbi:MAG: T9SS type A sorting domain-containing protein [Bacteroidales bacterium]|nr:T9SS type A sorting domain-containing protein [Bacteroidales bacterium]MCF8338157.1 T9SS type A sorting domain-containing protein [Bacteroidales bacterium]